VLQDFQPDGINVQPFVPGIINEIIGPKNMHWPGHGASPYHSHQSVEHEFMKADEYDLFINNTADYLFRVYLSRTTEATKGFQELPELSQLGSSGAQSLAEFLVRPEIARSIETLQKAGREIIKWRPKMRAFSEEIEKMGFPPQSQAFMITPFDVISNFYRSLRGTSTDMHRQPEKLIEACEKLLELTLKRPLPPPNKFGNLGFLYSHRGSDDFMSLCSLEGLRPT
jgi:hypothetical protein